jgi:hypothetical protein
MRKKIPQILPKTIRFFQGESEYKIPPYFTSMFTADIYNGIMPYRFCSDESELKINITGTKKDIELAYKLCESLCDNVYRGSIEDLISKAIENIVRQIVWEDKAYYEIIIGDDITCPYLHSFTSKRLFKFLNYYIQLVPKKDIQLHSKRFVAIKAKYVWSITFPKSLGRSKAFKKIVKKLLKINSNSPNFAKNNIVETFEMPGYNFKAYHRLTNVIVNKIVKKWGWNRRDSSNEYSTDIYRVYKYISFKYTQALIREHIVYELNKLLKKLVINSSITITGIKTSQDIIDIRRKVFSKEISLNDVFELF